VIGEIEERLGSGKLFPWKSMGVPGPRSMRAVSAFRRVGLAS
jgi:hypothetical protein